MRELLDEHQLTDDDVRLFAALLNAVYYGFMIGYGIGDLHHWEQAPVN